MSVAIAPLPRMQFNQGGVPLNGGLLFTYAAGTTNKLTTYTDYTGNTPNTNPIVLNGNGEANVYMTAGSLYKLTLSPSTDTDPPTNPYWTVDNLYSNTASAIPYADTGGTSDAITGSFVVSSPVLVDGYAVMLDITTPNKTTTPTFAATLNGTLQTARTIVKAFNDINSPIATGELQGRVLLVYDLPNLVWVLINVQPSEWVGIALTPTYVSGTQFTVPGNQTSIFTQYRRLQAVVTAGTIYGGVTTSSYNGGTGLTTVTCMWDSTALDNGLSQVSYSLQNPANSSSPAGYLIQNQTYTAFTTGGTTSAFTITPAPPLAAYTANQRFRVKFNATTVPTTATSGSLIVGQRYTITTFVTSDNFTNVGAGSNASGVTFIATGTTPTNWANGSTLTQAPTLNANALGNVPLAFYNPSGAKTGCGGNTIIANMLNDVEYDGTDMVVINPLQVNPAVNSPLNAKMSVTAAGTSGTFTADQVYLNTALNAPAMVSANYSKTINLSGTGAGGMDTGTAPVSGFVNLYAIATAGGAVSIIAQNASGGSPTIYGGVNMPATYIYSSLIGIWPTNGSSQFVPGLIQWPSPRKFWYKTLTAIFTNHADIVALTSQSISVAVPPAAKTVSCLLNVGTSTANIAFSVTMAADSSGTGYRQYLYPASGFTTTIASTIADVPIITTQTVYVLISSGGGNVSMYVSDYGW